MKKGTHCEKTPDIDYLELQHAPPENDQVGYDSRMWEQTGPIVTGTFRQP